MNNTPTGMIAAKRIAVAVATVCATLAAPAYAADDVKNVLDLMLKKGVISQQDYDQFMKDNADAAENKQFKEKRLDQDVGKANAFLIKNAEAGSVMKNGLGFQSADGANTAQMTGRVHWDARQFAQGPYQDRMEVRRARFGIRGQIAKDFKYEFIGDFGINGSSSTLNQDIGMSNTTTQTDVFYVDYAGIKDVSVRLGRFKMPYSLEQLTSSNNIDTIERSLTGQGEGELIPAKETGAMVFGSPMSGVTYAVAASRGRTRTTAATSTADYIGRFTANMGQLTGNTSIVAHLGLGYSLGEAASGTTMVSGRTEAREEDAYMTGSALTSIATRTRSGQEFAVAYDAFKLQAEQFNVRYDETAGGQRQIKGNYVQAVWNITGEPHNYSNTAGTFGGLKVKTPFTMNGGSGAWQLVIRHSTLDGSLANVTLSTKTTGASAWTYGINWVMNENARVMLNYVRTSFDTAVLQTGQYLYNQDAIVLRGQLAF
jgi:phosphate-selective porin OprO/OprP